MSRRKLGIYFPIVALLTIVAGAALYWRASRWSEIATLLVRNGDTPPAPATLAP